MNKEYIILISIWIFILGLATGVIFVADYYSEPKESYIDGGLVINSTMVNNENEFYYFNGEEVKLGRTKHRINSGDTYIRYAMTDSVDIPYVYQPRFWIEDRLNGMIIESDENHIPLAWLIVLFIGNSIVLIISIVKYERRKNANT